MPQSAHAYNSILVCGDKTATSPPFDSSAFRSNFVAQAMSSSAEGVTSGFWALSYKDLLEDLILPKLNILNTAAEVTVNGPIRKDWGTANASYQPVYALKRDFSSITDAGLPDAAAGFVQSPKGYERRAEISPIKEEYPASPDGSFLKTTFETSCKWTPSTFTPLIWVV